MGGIHKDSPSCTTPDWKSTKHPPQAEAQCWAPWGQHTLQRVARNQHGPLQVPGHVAPQSHSKGWSKLQERVSTRIYVHRICAQKWPSVLAEDFQQNQLESEIWWGEDVLNTGYHTSSESGNQKHLITITISSNPCNEKKKVACLTIWKNEIVLNILTNQSFDCCLLHITFVYPYSPLAGLSAAKTQLHLHTSSRSGLACSGLQMGWYCSGHGHPYQGHVYFD